MKTLNEILDQFYCDGENYFIGEDELGAKRHLKFLEIYQITEQFISLGDKRFIGFNTETEKWYGWCSWCIAGFGVGTKITRRHSLYRPKDLEEFLNYKSEEFDHNNVRIEDDDNIVYETDDGETYYDPMPMSFGQGEFVVESIEEAKQLAVEYAKR